MPTEPRRRYRQAVDFDRTEAMVFLAEILEDSGRTAEADAWYARAADVGDADPSDQRDDPA